MALLLACWACATPRVEGPRFEFSHANSIEEHWPFGLDGITTKFVAEPAKADNTVESYWLVRADWAGALSAEVEVRPEFVDAPLAPVRGVDYELVLGTDRNGATTSEIAPGRLLIEVPARAGKTGFAVRATFLGNGDGSEPPKSLLVEIVRVVDVASGCELPLGERKLARWLVVDPDSGR